MAGRFIVRVSLALSVAAFAVPITTASSGLAADLGGNCCADLEERIAELEATTARKGNRKVKLEISGFLNEAIFAWDDGVEQNAYVVTNGISASRVRFKGDAKIADGWNGGFLLELGVTANRQERTSQSVDGVTPAVGVRHSAWWMSSKEYGKVWVGLTSDAADGVTEVNLASTGHFASSNVPQSFGSGGAGFDLMTANGTLVSGVQLGDLVVNGPTAVPDSNRQNLVKYETPTIAGFIASASWGEDDIWNLGLRYSGEYRGFRLAAAVGYSDYSDGNSTGGRRGAASSIVGAPDVDVEEWGIGASVMHTETGLFVTVAYGEDDDNNAATAQGASGEQLALASSKSRLEFIQAGIERKFHPIGRTTMFGEYFRLERGLALNTDGTALNASSLGTAAFGDATLDRIVSSDLSGWGLGINQNLGDVIDVYVSYRHLDVEATLARADGSTGKPSLESFEYVTAGALVKF